MPFIVRICKRHLRTNFCIHTFDVRPLYLSYVNLYTNFCVRIFAYEILRTNICNTYFCRTYLILYIHLPTNICIRTFHRTYFCKGTFAYEFLRTYFCRTYFIPYVRTFAVRILYHTYFCIRTFTYEHLRTYFWHTHFIPYVYLRTNICVRTFVLRTLAIRTSVLQSFIAHRYAIYLAIVPIKHQVSDVGIGIGFIFVRIVLIPIQWRVSKPIEGLCKDHEMWRAVWCHSCLFCWLTSADGEPLWSRPIVSAPADTPGPVWGLTSRVYRLGVIGRVPGARVLSHRSRSESFLTREEGEPRGPFDSSLSDPFCTR